MFTSETYGNHTDYILQDCHERQYELYLQAHQEAERLKNKIISTAKEAIDEYAYTNKGSSGGNREKPYYSNEST